MSSKEAANPYQPGTPHSWTRTTCAAVFRRTLPRPIGRSTTATASSIAVPASIARGARKNIPLELIFFVTSVTGSGSRFPATLISCRGKLKHALGLRRRSSTTLIACVGTRKNVRCGRLVGILGSLGEDSTAVSTRCTFGSAPMSLPPRLGLPRAKPKKYAPDAALGQPMSSTKCLFPQHIVLELNNLPHPCANLRSCRHAPSKKFSPIQFDRKNRIDILSSLM